MICNGCSVAARNGQPHHDCPGGTWCDCQHMWRVGRSVGRTVYRMVGNDASKSDQLIGVMDTPELARRVVDAVNAKPAGTCQHTNDNEET